jgi:hypothetical protein
MPQVIEKDDSRITKGDPPIEATFRYSITQCFDEEQAAALVYTKAPLTYRGLVQDRANFGLQKTGYDSFAAELPYKVPEVGGDPPGGGGGGGDPEPRIVEFDTTGGTQHVTQCIEQVDYGPEAAPAIRQSRVVGLTRDGVEGVDVVVPKLEFGITVKKAVGVVTSAYVKNLARLTGKTNAITVTIDVTTYDPGELLFLGARGRKIVEDGEVVWEITFMFSASENRTDILVYDHADAAKKITVAAKKGHDYLWVLYKKDEADNRFVEVPDVAFVSKLYESGDFTATLGVL